MKPAAGMFLGGARSRLLPASIPFRFFGAALAYHVLAWLALLAGAPSFPRFHGGLGWPLAALHLTTLGVLAMSAIGASLQLLPVATRRSVGSTRLPVMVWWLFTPGVAALAGGMGAAVPALITAGALAVVLALLIFAALLAINLRAARGMPTVVAYGWTALASLMIVLASGMSLAFAYLGLPWFERGSALALHIPFSAYGFMGMLAFGMSYVLVPMFALAPAPDQRVSLAGCAVAASALSLGGAAAFGLAPTALTLAALALAMIVAAIHLSQMLTALRTGMRREGGQSFALIRVGWAMLLLSLWGGLAIGLKLPFEGAPVLFGVTLIIGWLLSFLLGTMRRILPFLASMHVSGSSKRPPTPSSLSAARPLSVHCHCHFAALGGLVVAILFDSPMIARLAAIIGAIGASAFGLFFVILVHRMRAGTRSASLASVTTT